mgnify:CR=1 FL=1
MKNLCNKLRPANNPYEVWGNSPLLPDWNWYVLKKYQNQENEDKNQLARWFCCVKTPIVPEGEYGDVYVKDIKIDAMATLIKTNP